MKVSIITPVYNCNQYITRCMESVLEQTFVDWELIIIDDGSVDETSVICKKYSDRDQRIRYYYQENQGQGAARNLGIDKARGEYLAFLDADDWWTTDTLFVLHQYASSHHTDLVFFDYYIVEDGTGETVKRIDKAPVCLDTITNTLEHPELIYMLKGSVWDKFYRKNIWEGIRQPGHPYEDSAVLPMILAKAKRIGQIRRPLYYYREGRPGSTVNRTDTAAYMLESMKEVKQYFFENNIFIQYQEPLRKYQEWMYLVTLNHVQRVSLQPNDEPESKYDNLLELGKQFMTDTYPVHGILFRLEYAVWGSYNLRCILNRSQRNLRIPKYHYSFSSIISLMSPKGKGINAKNHNPYRDRMLRSDMNREFYNRLRQEDTSIDYLCIDFMEERFPIIRVNDCFITGSDAFEETGVKGKVIAEPVSAEYITWWKEKAKLLIDTLKKRFQPEQMILVENYLCEGYGRYGAEQLYPEVECIQRQNQVLKELYQFFQEQWAGIKVISNDRQELLFTDEEHPHGCYPWHQNEYLYYSLADQIEKYVIADQRRKGSMV